MTAKDEMARSTEESLALTQRWPLTENAGLPW